MRSYQDEEREELPEEGSSKERWIGILVFVILGALIVPILLGRSDKTPKEASQNVLLPGQTVQKANADTLTFHSDTATAEIPAVKDNPADASQITAVTQQGGSVFNEVKLPDHAEDSQAALTSEPIEITTPSLAASKLPEKELKKIETAVSEPTKVDVKSVVAPIQNTQASTKVKTVTKHAAVRVKKQMHARATKAAKPVATAINPMHLLPTKGYVVQLGAFSERKRAVELVKKVRSHGFPVFAEVSHTPKGAVLIKVHVGPKLSKTEAQKLQKQLQQSINCSGVIVDMRTTARK